jgi:hypothetical protein
LEIVKGKGIHKTPLPPSKKRNTHTPKNKQTNKTKEPPKKEKNKKKKHKQTYKNNKKTKKIKPKQMFKEK